MIIKTNYAWHLSLKKWGRWHIEIREIHSGAEKNDGPYVIIPREHLKEIIKYLRGKEK